MELSVKNLPISFEKDFNGSNESPLRKLKQQKSAESLPGGKNDSPTKKHLAFKQKLLNPSSVLDNMLSKDEKQAEELSTIPLYKIKGFETYRKQTGLNIIRNKDEAEKTSKRSFQYKLH